MTIELLVLIDLGSVAQSAAADLLQSNLLDLVDAKVVPFNDANDLLTTLEERQEI